MSLSTPEEKLNDEIFYMEVSLLGSKSSYSYPNVRELERAYLYVTKKETIPTSHITLYKMYRGNRIAVTPGIWI